MTTWSGFDNQGNNGMKVGLDWSTSVVNNGSSSVTFSFDAWTGNRYNYSDSGQTIVWTGAISATDTYNNTQGSGTETKRASRSYTYTYPSGSYGTSPGNVTVTVRVGYSYNGSHPQLTVTLPIPARPIAAPDQPGNPAGVRNSDSQATVSWVNNASPAKPYSTVTVNRRTNWNNGFDTVATVPGSSSSWVDTGIAANQQLTYQIRANNAAGSSWWSGYSTTFYTTPAAPSGAGAALSGSTIVVTWTNNVSHGIYTSYVERSTGGGAWTVVASGLGAGTTTWTDTSPGGGTNQYRVRAHIDATSGNAELWSGYATSNVVSTMVPPLAPTLLAPSGQARDAHLPITLTWQHNPGADSAPQTAYQVRYSSNGGTSWTTLSAVTSATASHTLPADTLVNGSSYLWQVATKATHASYGPWSASATLPASSTPVVTLTAPADPVTSMPVTAAWVFNQDEGLTQATWEARLYDAAGVTVLQAGAGTTETAWTLTAALEDGVTYLVRVRARADTLWSAWAERAFTVDLLPPAPVTLTPSFDPGTGWMVLGLHADDPIPPGSVILRTNRHPNPFAGGGLTGWSTTVRAVSTAAVTRGGVGGMECTVTGTGTTHVTVWTQPTSSMTVTPGETLPVSVQVRVSRAGQVQAQIEWRTSGGTLTYTPTAWVNCAAGTITTLFLSPVVPAGVATARLVVTANGSALTTGDLVWVGGALIGGTGAPFDGATADTASLDYSWTGTPYASASTEAAPGTAAVTSVVVQRRIDSGPWVTITPPLPFGDDPDQTVLDTTPSLKATMEYRLVVTSISPSTAITDPVPYTTEGFRSTRWGFLSWGPGYSRIVRAAGNPGLGDKPERAREVKRAAGRQYPILLLGDQLTRIRSVTLLAVWDEVAPGRESSTDAEWIAASLEAGIVCWRDWTGVRIFGRLDGMQVTPRPDDVSAEITFSVEQTDHREGVA